MTDFPDWLPQPLIADLPCWCPWLWLNDTGPRTCEIGLPNGVIVQVQKGVVCERNPDAGGGIAVIPPRVIGIKE